MSDAIYQAKAAAMAVKNDALRDAFALDGVRCFALSRIGQTSQFTHLFEFTSGHDVKFDDNRSESGLFRYATTDIDGFRDIWARTTDIGYGVPNGDTEIEVYSWATSPESGSEKDRIDPDGRSVYFSGRMVRDAKSRYPMPIPATGDYTFGVNPSDGDNFPTLNGYAPLIFKSVSAFWYELEIKATLALTIANIIAVFTANDVFTEINFTSDATKLYLEAVEAGIDGNAFTLGTATANITPSGATLTGGTG